MKEINEFSEFFRTRLKPGLWALAALIICLVGGELLHLSWPDYSIIFVLLLAFRCLDEAGSRKFDLIYKNRRVISVELKTRLFFLSFLGSILALAMGAVQGLHFWQLASLLTFFLLSSLGYWVFQKSRACAFISLLKYPFLLWLITPQLNSTQVWISTTAFFMLFILELRSESLSALNPRRKT